MREQRLVAAGALFYPLVAQLGEAAVTCEVTLGVGLSDHKKGSEIWQAFDVVLKGKEIRLPDGHYFIDKDGHKRTECRTKWWLNPEGLHLNHYLFHAPATISNIVLSLEYNSEGYNLKDPTVFFGHYWLDADTGPICLNARQSV